MPATHATWMNCRIRARLKTPTSVHHGPHRQCAECERRASSGRRVESELSFDGRGRSRLILARGASCKWSVCGNGGEGIATLCHGPEQDRALRHLLCVAESTLTTSTKIKAGMVDCLWVMALASFHNTLRP